MELHPMSVRTFSLALVLILLAGGCRRGVKSVDDEPPAATAEEASDRFLKAVAGKDIRAMAGVSDVPWLDRDRSVIRDREGLSAGLERTLAQTPDDLGAYTAEMIPYRELQRNITDEAERKLLDEVMGPGGVIIELAKEGFPLAKRYLLIRVADGKAAVVAGPLKENQLVPSNPIPPRVERLLDQAETFELYSLDPTVDPRSPGKARESSEKFHEWMVLGKTEVKEPADRKKLVDALRLAAEDNAGTAIGHFIPRHGLRLTSGKETVELVICFECLSIQVYVNGNMAKGFLTTGDPQKEFDAILNAAGVKLSAGK
jgi:hypothetical protein